MQGARDYRRARDYQSQREDNLWGEQIEGVEESQVYVMNQRLQASVVHPTVAWAAAAETVEQEVFSIVLCLFLCIQVVVVAVHSTWIGGKGGRK